MGYKGDLGSSPLDGVVNFIDGVRHGGRNAKQKVADAKDAVNLKAKAQAKIAQKKAEATANVCKKIGHSGKRGETCKRCPTKIL